MARVLMGGVIAVLLVLPTASADEKSDPHKIPADAKAILEKADSFELLSLETTKAKKAPKENFYGFTVLGKTTIDKAKVQKALVDSFSKGVAEYKGGGARCFLPRHGIRVKHDGKAADFVICFECHHVRVYVDGEAEQAFLVSDSPAKVFNDILIDAGIKLAKPPKPK